MNFTRNQQLIIWQGGLFSLYNILTSFYLVAFALALGASNSVIGILGATPYAATLLGEIPGAKLIHMFGRKRLAVVCTLLGRLGWIPIILAPTLFTANPLLGIVSIYFLVSFVQEAGVPAWVGIMSDVVPAKQRGTIFGTRVRTIEIGAAIATFAGGVYLNLFPPGALTGFLTLMAAGVLFGLASVTTMNAIREPKDHDGNNHKISEFFNVRGSFRKYLLFISTFYFAVMLASPFFTVYILRDLQMSYAAFGISTALTSLAKIASIKAIGRLSDRIGDKNLALLSVLGTALVPAAFMFITPETTWIVYLAQIYSGIVWAGVDLLQFNLFLDHSTARMRAVQTAEYTIAMAIPSIIAPVLGGIIADLSVPFLSGIPLIFGIAVVLRILSATLLLRLPEKRGNEMPMRDVIREVVHFHASRGPDVRVRHVGRGR